MEADDHKNIDSIIKADTTGSLQMQPGKTCYWFNGAQKTPWIDSDSINVMEEVVGWKAEAGGQDRIWIGPVSCHLLFSSITGRTLNGTLRPPKSRLYPASPLTQPTITCITRQVIIFFCYCFFWEAAWALPCNIAQTCPFSRSPASLLIPRFLCIPCVCGGSIWTEDCPRAKPSITYIGSPQRRHGWGKDSDTPSVIV